MLQPTKMTATRRPARGLGALALALTLLLPQAAHAHQVWLEEHSGGTKLYFGEFADNLHEVSPGYLDKLVRPTATLISGQKGTTLTFATTSGLQCPPPPPAAPPNVPEPKPAASK